MGMVFGRIAEELPRHSIVSKHATYQIRRYEPSIAVQCDYSRGWGNSSDGTPFGFGRPYSQSQLETQLKQHNFLPERHATALFQPPSDRPFWRRTAGMWERMGARLSMVVSGGVLMVEATKRVQAPSGPGLREKVRRPLGVLVPQPEAKPVGARTGLP